MSFAICTLVFLANENFISSFALHQFPLNCNQVVRDLCKFLKYWMDCLREWIYECNLFGAKVNKFWRRNRGEISLRYVACWTEFHYIWWRCFSSKCSSSCKVKKTTNKIWDLMQKKISRGKLCSNGFSIVFHDKSTTAPQNSFVNIIYDARIKHLADVREYFTHPVLQWRTYNSYKPKKNNFKV